MKFQTQIITEQIEYKTNGTGLIENERLVEWLRYVDEDGYADDLVDKMVELGFDAAVDWLTYEWIGDPATAEMIVDFFTR